MPPKLSKFSINASCEDYSHPWSVSCVSATAGLGLHSLQESIRIYSTLYVLTLLMKGKIPSKEDVKRTLIAIIQSTSFLSWSAFSYSMFMCILRRALGNFNVLTVSFMPSFLSSFSAIILERPSRRTMLCLYVSNIATETLFRMGVWRGYFSVIPKSEIYIFAISIAILLYYFRKKKNKQDSIYKIIRFVVGPYEDIEFDKKNLDLKNSNLPTIELEKFNIGRKIMTKNVKRNSFAILWKAMEAYKQIIKTIKAQGKHVKCPHPYSCAHYILTGGLKLFGYGICGQLVFKLVFQTRRLLKKPSLFKSLFFKRDNLNLAVFLGGFAGIYRLVSCSLRRIFDKDSDQFAIPAGLLASTAFLMYPDNTISLYIMWKALQMLWNDAVEKGKVPEMKGFEIFLYCFSTAVLFHAAIIEPQNLRPSYWKFLHNLSGGRIATMSRIPLDEFGLHSSKSLEFVLKQTHTTNKIIHSF